MRTPRSGEVLIPAFHIRVADRIGDWTVLNYEVINELNAHIVIAMELRRDLGAFRYPEGVLRIEPSQSGSPQTCRAIFLARAEIRVRRTFSQISKEEVMLLGVELISQSIDKMIEIEERRTELNAQ